MRHNEALWAQVEYRFSSIAQSHTPGHTRQDQHSTVSVPKDPIPDLCLSQELICEALEKEIMQLSWLRELGETSDDQLAEQANFEHKFLECLTILRHD